MLPVPEGTGINAPHTRGMLPSCQQEIQDACTILAQKPRSTNSHLCPLVPGGHSPRPLVSPAFTDNKADNSANLAAWPAIPKVDCTALPMWPAECTLLSSFL